MVPNYFQYISKLLGHVYQSWSLISPSWARYIYHSQGDSYAREFDLLQFPHLCLREMFEECESETKEGTIVTTCYLELC